MRRRGKGKGEASMRARDTASPAQGEVRPLAGRRILITGISDGVSLATEIARAVLRAGGLPVCAGLGPTPHQHRLSERARAHLETAYESFRKTVASELDEATPALACDLSLDASLRDLAAVLAERDLPLDGILHAVAFDRTLRRGRRPSILETSRDEFMECMNVSAWSLVALVRELVAADMLRDGAGIVALSYLGAERVVEHPYKSIGVAKAALERIVRELAAELGPDRGIRVNAVRFSPYSASRAGGAIPGLEAAERRAGERSPLGLPTPTALAAEVLHLLRPGGGVTGEVRHVDGGQHLLA